MSRRRAPATLPGNLLVGRTAEARIERIVSGGFGLAHALGRTIFVAGVAPGELATVRIDRTPGKIAFGSVVELLEPSPARIEPPFPELTRLGADFQHLTYEAQLEAKLDIITDCLRRIGNIETELEIPIEPSAKEWGYRARAEWHHDPATGAFGYVEAGSHRVVDLPVDPFVVPALAATFAALRKHLAFAPEDAEPLAVRAAAGDDDRVALDPALLPGTEGLVQTVVAGEHYAYDASCFFQTNPTVLAPMVAEALRHAGDDDPTAPSRRLAIDLFSGVGLFTLPLARRFERVIAVESHGRTAELAAHNIARAGLGNVRLETAAVEAWIGTAYKSHGRAPLLLVDPPRTGLPPVVVRGIVRLRPGRITYVSCDPATLARDLKALIAADYRLDGMAAFDMFPQTHHVEVVAHLRRATEPEPE